MTSGRAFVGKVTRIAILVQENSENLAQSPRPDPTGTSAQGLDLATSMLIIGPIEPPDLKESYKIRKVSHSDVTKFYFVTLFLQKYLDFFYNEK